MLKKLGFIGTGNIGSAIIEGVVKAGLVSSGDITASDINTPLLTNLAKTHGIRTTSSNKETAERSGVLFLCTKPNTFDTVIDEISSHVMENCIVVSVAAGLSVSWIKSKFGKDVPVKVVRAMPNIPAIVNCGMTALSVSNDLTSNETEWLLGILSSFGKAELLQEHLFDAFTAIAASSPAYAFMFIEALADAGVKHGLSRSQALRFSGQAVLGAAKLLQESDQHPALLKDSVCTPGGTTIEAVCELEKQGFKNTVISGVNVCVLKSIEMGSRLYGS